MGTSEIRKWFEILLVEDNRGDVDLTRESLKQAKFKFELRYVQDGEEAMNYLHRRGRYLAAPTPDLVLLDLNLPKKDGREVLAEIKSDPVLKRIPVVVLTSSEADEDIRMAYTLGANCYVTKPFSLDDFLDLVHRVVDFWLTRATLPPRDPN